MKWAIREAVDVYFKAKTTFQLGARTMRAGEPVLIFDTVKTSTLETAAEVVYCTGGRGNNRVLSFEGDKTVTFSFEEALLSAEGMAILTGADLIPARNNHLLGSHPDARSIITHFTEKYSVATVNLADEYAGSKDVTGKNGNVYPEDETIINPSTAGTRVPRGGEWNIWLTEKPYVGQNASIYVMLLDDAGEMSGSPLQINLENTIIDTTGFTEKTTAEFTTGTTKGTSSPLAVGKYLITDTQVAKEITTIASTTADAVVKTLGYGSTTYIALSKFSTGDQFIAMDINNQPIALAKEADTPTSVTICNDLTWNDTKYSCGEWDDKVLYYVDFASMQKVWAVQFANFGDIANYTRTITATGYGQYWGDVDNTKPSGSTKGFYPYLLKPSGGVAQPKAYRESSTFYYKLNVPSILYQDIVLLDYYVEYQHDATQVSILPDKFAPYMYIEGSSLVRRASDGIDLPIEFVIPKAKIKTAISFTMTGTGDPATFNFEADAFPDFSKFDLTRKVLADIQILDADDNFDGTTGITDDPTSYRRYHYNNDTDGEYLWKDRSLVAHQNIDYSDTADTNGMYGQENGGPVSFTPGIGTAG